MAKSRTPKRKPPTQEQAVNLLVATQRRRAAVELECKQLQRDFENDLHARVDEVFREFAQRGVVVRKRLSALSRLASGADRLKRLLGEDQKVVIDTRKVDDPAMSHAEIVEQRKRWPTAHDIGRVKARSNMINVIGGFARFDKRTDAEVAAAMRFLTLHQQAEISDQRAMDYAAPLVDVSWSGDAEKVMLSGEAARQALDAVRAAIGIDMFDLLTAIIVRDVSVRTIAGPDASGGRIRTWGRRVRHGLDQCAEHWHLRGEGAKVGRLRAWDDGSPRIFTGEIVNPRHELTGRD